MDYSKYFDINGSTPAHEGTCATFTEHLMATFGNSGAVHPEGLKSRQVIGEAREIIASSLGAKTSEIFFTSGGTEANNWALSGVARSGPGRHFVVSAIEHKSVLRTASALMDQGFECTFVPASPAGHVDVDTLRAALRKDTFLVSVMLANNETGVLQPVKEIGDLCRERGIRFHCDAVAAIGKVPVKVEDIGCDLLSLSSHKLYAPKGCGLLYVKQGKPLGPMIFGCGQQNGMRSGTENTAGVASFGKAFELLEEGAFGAPEHLASLKHHLFEGVRKLHPRAEINGTAESLPNTLNVYLPGCTGESILIALGQKGYCVAAGAAVTNGQASHVLKAMGHSDARAVSSVRFSLGCYNTRESVDTLLVALDEVLSGVNLRQAVS